MTNIKAVDVSEIEKLAYKFTAYDSYGGSSQDMHVVDITDIRALLERSPSVSEHDNLHDFIKSMSDLSHEDKKLINDNLWNLYDGETQATIPEGRLLDADALIEAFEKDIASYDNVPNLYSAIETVRELLSANQGSDKDE